MRYTKELRAAVVADVERGIPPDTCAVKYGLSEDLVRRWASLDFSFERAKETVMHRYSPAITEAETEITNGVAEVSDCSAVSDSRWNKLCDMVFKSVFKCAAKIVQSERRVATGNSGEKDAILHLKVFERFRERNRPVLDEAADTGRSLALSLS